MSQLSFYPIAESYLLVALAALLLVALAFLVPIRRELDRRRRWILLGLRLAVIAMMTLAMLRPTLVMTEIGKQAATLVVLADTSRSMSVPDGLRGRSRWEEMRGTLDEAREPLARVDDEFEVKAYTFDAELHPAELADGRLTLEKEPTGEQTALGAALEDVLREEAGKRLLGVVLLSDGAQRAYAPRDVAPQMAAARMKSLGFSLYSVPFGKAQGLGQAKDLAVTQLLAGPNVFVKNELPISGRIRVDGYANREIPIRLLFETEPGNMEVVAEKTVTPTAEGELIPIEFTYVPEAPGEFKISLDVPELPGELVTTNNRLSTFINVLKGGLNVLYVEGALRVEQKFIRRALDASPDINMDYLRLDPRRPESRPGDLSERFQPGQYRVYLLGDVPASVFTSKELEDLTKSVYRGAGLMMLGGFQSFGPGGYGTTPLGEVLPIRMGRLERQGLDEPIRRDLHLPGPLTMRPTRFGQNHFSLMLTGDVQENLALWSELPPLEGANRFAGIKPSGIVLAATERGDPLLVAHRFGDGRVLAFAGDSTWHWWMRGFETIHKRFWRQTILWLAKKDETAEGNVWIRLDQRRLRPGGRLTFSAGAQAPTGEPLDDVQFQAELVLPDGSTLPARMVEKADEWTGSVRDVQMAGDYAIRVRATRQDAPVGAARARFLVVEQDLELDNPAADVAGLENLAVTTGGAAVPPEQLPKLLDRLCKRTEDLEIRSETKRTFWDTGTFFLILVGFLGLDWYLRKRWGMA